MAERTSTCHSPIETLQVYLHVSLAPLPPPQPQLPQAAFAPVLDRTHDGRRPGAASLASKITRPNTMRIC